MLKGVVTSDRVAVLTITVLGAAGQRVELNAVLDTGFDGSLALPAGEIAALGLRYHSTGHVELADGSTVRLRRYTGTIVWNGAHRTLRVIQTQGGTLLGMSLLARHRVQIDVIDGGPVIVDPL